MEIGVEQWGAHTVALAVAGGALPAHGVPKAHLTARHLPSARRTPGGEAKWNGGGEGMDALLEL